MSDVVSREVETDGLLPPFTRLRFRRLECRMPLHHLAVLARVSMSRLSRAERNAGKLNRDEAERVDTALRAAKERIRTEKA